MFDSKVYFLDTVTTEPYQLGPKKKTKEEKKWTPPPRPKALKVEWAKPKKQNS